MRGQVFLGALMAVAVLGLACGPARPLSLEERARMVERNLICPVCPGETVDQSQAPLAKQMRDLIRVKLQEGWTEEQIYRFFVDRYGEGVLAAPPRRGLGMVAWVVPPLVVAGGLGVLALVVRAMARRPSPPSPPPAEGGDYLSLIEAERREGPSRGGPSP